MHFSPDHLLDLLKDEQLEKFAVSDRIRILRRRMRLKPIEMATLIGIGAASYLGHENGHRKNSMRVYNSVRMVYEVYAIKMTSFLAESRFKSMDRRIEKLESSIAFLKNQNQSLIDVINEMQNKKRKKTTASRP